MDQRGGVRRVGHAVSRAVALLAVMVLLLAPPPAQAQGVATFSRVDVAGNHRIEAETIRVFAGIQPGQAVTPEQMNLAVRRLFDTGLFEDVTVMPEAGRLVITVVENPSINQIAFEGNRSLEDEELAEAIELRSRRAYSAAAAEADAQRVIDAYRAAGRYGAEVTPVIIRLPENRVNLVFQIVEGRPTRVQRVNFVGNEVFSDNRLRRVVGTSQANLLSSVFGSGQYDQDRLEVDREQLRQFYLERGFVDFTVRSAAAELLPERNGFFVTFVVSEGKRYDFGEMGVASSVPGLNPADFEPLLGPVLGGGVYNAKLVERVVERLAFQAGQQGYAFLDVRPRVTKNEAARTVDIVFELVEGQRVFIERIDITGNTRTLDRVIRRQFDVVEGDAFNAREIRDAENRIKALEFFSAVTVGVNEGTSPSRALVTVEVEEQPTGSLNLGGSFSSSEGAAVQISITERNFLGRGQTVSAALTASTEFTNVDLTFVEPALFDRDLLGGFNVFYRDRNYNETAYKTRDIGFVPRVGFPLSENGRLQLRYFIQQTDIFDVKNDTSRIIAEEQGKQIASGLGATYTYDRRNSPIDPTAGFILTLSQEFAGLGGDATYSKTSGTARAYTSFFDEDLVLTATLEGGALFAKDGSRVTERFITGGDSFRGFARNGVGPRDVCGFNRHPDCTSPQETREVDDPLGGNFLSVLRLDASFPLGPLSQYGIYGGVFSDIGSLWGLDEDAGSMGHVDSDFYLRATAGISLFVETPFAPLRFNFSQPLRDKGTDETENFRFTVATRF
ncbi:outer membrane protein assembly factor BamA [Amaricoccus sp.]|uniref:outer membrane protein assembly factor BamA n=1 Tax=Amaricoccus sp. TaxID=1872485 RepID=UPI001B421C2E|nr:outer membrane protein assembly factor BamA [Amaricoccus sp.]MBP7241693.1 outer membrane protein assembly factor BamA [Amaricoccus sp.]